MGNSHNNVNVSSEDSAVDTLNWDTIENNSENVFDINFSNVGSDSDGVSSVDLLDLVNQMQNVRNDLQRNGGHKDDEKHGNHDDEKHGNHGNHDDDAATSPFISTEVYNQIMNGGA